MPKNPSLLQVIPNRNLVFTGPFTGVTKADLQLRNISSGSVCFKVRTTAPEQYCVQPNSGFLRPGEWKRLTITLQPLKGTPPETGRHKFMIQSCVPPPEYFVDMEEIWEEVDPADITLDKLTVAFVDRGNSRSEESSASARRAPELGASCSAPYLQSSGYDTNTSIIPGHQETSASARQAQEVPPSYSASQDAAFLSLRESLKSNTDENEELKNKVDRLEKLIDVMLKFQRNLKNQQTQSNDDGPSSSTSQDATMQKSQESFADKYEELQKRVVKLEQPSFAWHEQNLKHQQTQTNDDGPSPDTSYSTSQAATMREFLESYEELQKRVDKLEQAADVVVEQDLKHQQTQMNDGGISPDSTSQAAAMRKSLKSLADRYEELQKRVDRLKQAISIELEQNLKHRQTQASEDGPSPDTSHSTSQEVTILESLKSLADENEKFHKRIDKLYEAVGVELEQETNNHKQQETESKNHTSEGFVYTYFHNPSETPYVLLKYVTFYSTVMLIGFIAAWLRLLFTEVHVEK